MRWYVCVSKIAHGKLLFKKSANDSVHKWQVTVFAMVEEFRWVISAMKLSQKAVWLPQGRGKKIISHLELLTYS